jgi:glycine/D-amino acid oxidase-like deaminating enzyme
MPSPNPAPRVAVLGGGILGVSTAVHLLRQGASVVLVTESQLCSEATGRSLSWLNSAGSRSEPYHRLRVLGMDRYRTLYASDPGRDWLQFNGGLRWNRAGLRGQTEARHEHEQAHGYDSRLLSQEEVPAIVPGVDPDAVPELAVFNPGEGWVSLPELVDYLMQEFHERGGELVLNAGRGGLLVKGGRAAGIGLTSGKTYDADAVVVACGAATPSVLAPLGPDLPNGSPLSMLVVTKPVEHNLRTVLNTPRVAARPNPGGALALDHDWYESRLKDHGDGTFSVSDDIVAELADEASLILKGHPELKPASWKVGYKPIPGDGEPVLGEVSAVPGCFAAFTHSGATLGLIAGELLAAEIVTGRRHPLLAAFSPDRFN